MTAIRVPLIGADGELVKWITLEGSGMPPTWLVERPVNWPLTPSHPVNPRTLDEYELAVMPDTTVAYVYSRTLEESPNARRR